MKEILESELTLLSFCQVCTDSCCYTGPVYLLESEYNQIIEQTGKTQVFEKHKDGFYILNKEKGKPCPFLVPGKHLCSIQNIKPIECKAWPVYFGQGGTIRKHSISHACIGHKSLDETYIIEAKRELKKIPYKLRKVFYNLTVSTGYSLNSSSNPK